MRISERRVGEVTVVDVAGRLTLNEGLGRVKDVVQRLVSAQTRHIVLNMAAVGYVDSSWLGELVSCHLSAVRGGSVIKLSNPGEKLEHLLTLTRLNTVLEVHGSEAAAIESFAAARV
ncbi:MAG: STAS domain-containing protein [Acidobacteriota bacterium]